MKILFLISGDRAPASRFRVLAYLPYLRSAGFQCAVAASFPQKYDHFPAIGWRPSQLLKRTIRWWHLLRARVGRYDLVFVEREIFDDHTSYMEERFRRAVGRMVLDVDDGIFLRYPEKFERIARMSDLVIAGNRFLQQRIEPLNPRSVVIPTCVDLNSYPMKPQNDSARRPVVGWIGTTGNLEYLRVVAPALRKLAAHCDFELRLVAPQDTPLRSLDLTGVDVRFVPWEGATEVDELLEFDIGMMPLFAEQEWNIYKCGLKLIQYMAIGIPGVASPVGVNAEIVQHGENGFLAASDAEWEDVLLRLVQDPELRRRTGAAARRTVKERYSIEANLPLLIESLDQLMLLPAAKGPAAKGPPANRCPSSSGHASDSVPSSRVDAHTK